MYWRIHLLCIAGMFKIFPVDYYVIVGAEEAGVTSRYGSGFTKIMRVLAAPALQRCFKLISQNYLLRQGCCRVIIQKLFFLNGHKSLPFNTLCI
jgi:hypothetical protein